MSLAKFESRVKRLSDKIGTSKTPVPGFIMGLSGTDSIVSFAIMYEALKRHGMESSLCGVHYVWAERKKKTWFEEHVVPWLRERYQETHVSVTTPYGGQNIEEARWADLKIRCSQGIPMEVRDKNNWQILPYIDKRSYWAAACINATEKRLGKYTILSKSASVWPVATLWKTDILSICEALDAPAIAIENSRLPDCLCGRDELAAANIEIIDQILRNEIDPTQHDPELLKTLFAWIKDIKGEYDFKERTPYMI